MTSFGLRSQVNRGFTAREHWLIADRPLIDFWRL
jgi:hypothetical protein